MPEYSATAAQTVLTGQNVLFTTDDFPCTRGLVIHRPGSGLFTLRGPGCGCNQCYARYKVTFGANLAVPPAGAPADGVSVAISVDGEPLASTNMISTPSAVSLFNNVSRTTFVRVPRGCCATVGIENNGTQGLEIENANIVIERTA